MKKKINFYDEILFSLWPLVSYITHNAILLFINYGWRILLHWNFILLWLCSECSLVASVLQKTSNDSQE